MRAAPDRAFSCPKPDMREPALAKPFATPSDPATAGHDSALHVNFLLQPHFSLLAFTAAADALITANLVTGRPLFAFHTSALNENHVISDLGIHLPADEVIADHAQQTDEQTGGQTSRQAGVQTRSQTDGTMSRTAGSSGSELLLVCGGYRCDLAENRLLSDFLRLQADRGIQLGGLWNGILALAHAGLMDGRACAVHPDNHSRARMEHPQLQLRSDTVVIDRDRLSAAGPNSAFELMLLLVRRHDSADTVQQIRQILRAYSTPAAPHDAGSQLANPPTLPKNLRSALQLMHSNLDEPVNKIDLARHVNLSPRAVERLFQRHLGTSPARYYLELRLQRAHDLLTNSQLSIGAVGETCGFVSTAHFSRTFSSHFGISPSAVRRLVTPRWNT